MVARGSASKVRLALLFCLVGASLCLGGEEPVWHLVIDQPMLSECTSKAVANALKNAAAAKAKLAVIEIKSVTGRFDEAVETSKAIFDSKLPCYALVAAKEGAVWEGAVLIAVSCKAIYIMPEATIGVTRPMPDVKKAEMTRFADQLAASAKSNGYSHELVRAVTFPGVALWGQKSDGKWTFSNAKKEGAETLWNGRTPLVLKAADAVRYGLAKQIVKDLSETLTELTVPTSAVTEANLDAEVKRLDEEARKKAEREKQKNAELFQEYGKKAQQAEERAKLADPRKSNFKYSVYPVGSPKAGQFRDGGQTWRNNIDICISYLQTAYSYLGKQLSLARNDERLQGQIGAIQSKMKSLDSYAAEVNALRGYKGPNLKN